VPNLLAVVFSRFSFIYFSREKYKTERGSKGPGLALLAGAFTVFLLKREDLGMSPLLCPGKMEGKLKCSFLNMFFFSAI
jgi:hypothetical protein